MAKQEQPVAVPTEKQRAKILLSAERVLAGKKRAAGFVIGTVALEHSMSPEHLAKAIAARCVYVQN